MKNDYQLGSDDEWLKHSNEELAQMIKKRDRRILRLQIGILVLLAALGWVIFKFSRKSPLPELWHFQPAQREIINPRLAWDAAPALPTDEKMKSLKQSRDRVYLVFLG
jgi:hypothetical protein